MSPRAADVERLIERAGKVSRCIYIAVEPEVADDVSGVIRDLVEALRALGAAREAEGDRDTSVPGGDAVVSPPSVSALSPAAREGLDRVLDGYRLAETLLAARRAVADVRAYVERLVAEAEGRGLARHVAYLDRMEEVLGPVRLRRSTGEPSESDFDAVARLVAAAAPSREDVTDAIDVTDALAVALNGWHIKHGASVPPEAQR